MGRHTRLCLFVLVCLCQLIQWHSIVVEVVYAHLALACCSVLCNRCSSATLCLAWRAHQLLEFGPLGIQEK
jgi:hypothetical protein